MSGKKIISMIPGGLKFWSIIFSKPLPIEQIKKTWGQIPIKVAQKKLRTLTLKIHGKTFDIANGMPPIDL